ncbi:MAG: metallophosphoesterase [Phycisphaerae bacterium]|nr:metallophosphoesterase [Phycisphaerae bacterium]
MNGGSRVVTARCVLAGAVLLAGGRVFGGAPSIHNKVYQAVQGLEIKALPSEPAWARMDAPPLFTFAWMSDFHLDGSNQERTRLAMRYVDRELKPDFVMITGDNNAYAPEFQHEGRVPPVTLRRQLFMKRFLEENLRAPYVIIPGDDWPQDFEKVFGAFQFSFNYGGMHFLFASLDRCTYGVEGRAVFDEATWEWMRQDLARNKDRPTLFMMHETLVPPAFIDAVRTRKMLEEHPNVIASFCGHLHVDVEFTHEGIRYLVCPSLGRNARCGFKYVQVYRQALILRTVEYNKAKNRYEKVMKWQRVEIPQALQASLHKPASRTFTKADCSEVPPHPRRSDPTLMKRTMELVGPLMGFVGQMMNSGALRSQPAGQGSGATGSGVGGSAPGH